jgi:acyl-CoA reductase-like NAD-dependent aldehyde dehydrogenase
LTFEANAMAASAIQAFEAWRTTSRYVRRHLLQAWIRHYGSAAHELALLLTEETGKPITLSRGEVARGILTLEATLEALAGFGEEAVPYDLMAGAEGCRASLRRRPRGPVLAITPFNFPVNLALHKLAPAVAAGCSVLWKPCPQAPRTSRLLWDSFEAGRDEVGAPAGLLQLLQVPPAEAEALALHPDVAVVSFTGSERVGMHLRGLLPHKTVILELGGNAAVVLDAGVDAAAAARQLAPAAVAAAGQSCCKAQRFYIHQDLWDAFVRAFVAAVQALPCGDPMDPKTVVGPLIDEATATRLDASLDRAVGQGATILLRGERRGALLPPAILTDLADSDPLQCEELFGPITILNRVATFEEGLQRAAATRFGLRAAVYSRDLGHLRQAEAAFRAGTILLNLPPTFRLDAAPFGGLGASGQGLEGPRWAMEAFTEPTLVVEGPEV